MADPKTLKAHPAATAGIVVGENSVRLTVTEENNVSIDERGTTISGPMSLATSPNQIRISALFTFQTIAMGVLPSTMATPSAMYMIDPPVKQVANLVKQVAIMAGIIDGTIAAGS